MPTAQTLPPGATANGMRAAPRETGSTAALQDSVSGGIFCLACRYERARSQREDKANLDSRVDPHQTFGAIDGDGHAVADDARPDMRAYYGRQTELACHDRAVAQYTT
jgi:hypothetical protein